MNPFYVRHRALPETQQAGSRQIGEKAGAMSLGAGYLLSLLTLGLQRKARTWGGPGRLEARGPAQLHPAVECESGPEASVRIVLILSEQANPSIA